MFKSGGGNAMNASSFSNSVAHEAPSTFEVGRGVVPTHRPGFQPTNLILAALQQEVLSRLLPHLKLEYLHRSKVLCDVDEPLSHIYFVEKGLVSMVAVFEDRTTAEMATVGREGLVGISSVLGGSSRSFGRYVVPMPGLALAIENSQFRRALRESSELRAACESYARAFLREALQTAACNSVHMVEQRCVRWLLMSHDRSDSDTLTLTQAYLADMLGVCRSTVTLVAGALQKAGLIRYRRGAIKVLDRLGLEAASCECYRVIREQYERLLPRPCERRLPTRKLSLVDEPHLSRAFS
jgi:CRP-like cAMP-binding protein